MAYDSLNRPSLVFTKNSINSMSPHVQKFCMDLVEFIDGECISSDDAFFYDMMKFIRFQKIEDDGIAYTDTNGLIVMNPPNRFKSLPEWDFIYDHECMHQLWDTFAVGDRIKASGRKYDHMILNIASDCVINDYLEFVRKKPTPGGPNGGLVTPEYLKEKFGIIYDRKNDTQYTLYIKIMDAIQEDPSLANKLKQQFGKLEPKSVTYVPMPPIGGGDDIYPQEYVDGYTKAIQDVFSGKVDPLKYRPGAQVINLYFSAVTSKSALWQAGYDAAMEKIRVGLEQGIQIGKGPRPPGGDGKTNLPQIPWDIPQEDKDQISKMDGDQASGTANQAAKEAEQAAREADAANDGSEDGKANADQAKEAAAKAKEAADQAKEAARKGDTEGAREAAKEAVRQARQAKTSAQHNMEKKARQKGGGGGRITDPGGGPSSNVDYGGIVHLSPDELIDLEKELIASGTIRKENKDVLGGWLIKNSGFIGNFLKKCRASKDMKESGLDTNAGQRKTNWGAKVFNDMDNFIADVVREHKLQYRKTYSRLKRGSMVPKPGEFLSKGKQRIDEKFPISIAFWLDCSGSMGDGAGSRLWNAGQCMYALADAIEKSWSSEALISEFNFDFNAWDEAVYPLKKGQIPKNSSNGTMSLDELVSKHLIGDNKASMINIVITDGGGGLGSSTFNRYIKNLEGIVIFVTNSPAMDVKHMADQCDQLYYEEAPGDFSLS